MEESRPHLRRGGDRRRSLLIGWERGCRPRFIVILDKPHQLTLVGWVGLEMSAYRACTAMRQPVVQSFVVAVVKTELLQRPFRVPVRLGEEDEAGMCPLDGAN